MKIIVKENYEQMCEAAAILFQEAILRNPAIVLGLATGSTPLGIYQQWIDAHRRGELDFSRVRSFNLDEYVGLDEDHPQSYHYFMEENLFRHINMDPKNHWVPNGTSPDLQQFCRSYEAMIEAAGGIDLQLLGIGENGHIAFNEPAAMQKAVTTVVELTDNTIEVNSRFFERKEDVPTRAVTMGIGTILRAKKIVLVANGPKKAAIIRRLLEMEDIDPWLPASFLWGHPDVTLILDREAYGGSHD